eukprot:5279515-Prymnesium_polylepis.1
MSSRPTSGLLPSLLLRLAAVAVGAAGPPLASAAPRAKASKAEGSSSLAALLPGSAVGPYLLLERVRSVPSTYAPSTDLEMVGRSSGGSSTDLVGHRSSVEPTGFTQLLLPDADLASDEISNAVATEVNTTAPSAPPAGTWPALPSPDVPETPKLPQSFESELLSTRTAYRLHRRVQRGSHGEVWRAVRRDDTSGVPLILKRLHQGTIDGAPSAALLAGLRERHFGEVLRGLPRLARFVECFEEGGSFWLVFRDEGISLRDLLYTWRPPHAAKPASGGGGGGGAGDGDGGEAPAG